MKRILFITNIIPHYRKTFYEKLVLSNKYEWLIVKGKKEKEDGRPDYKKLENLPVNEVEDKNKKIGPYILKWQKNTLGIARNYKPDIIILLGIVGYISNWLILIWAKLQKIPVIMWTCGWEKQKEKSLSLMLKQSVMKIFYSFPNVNLVYSSKAKKYLTQIGISSKKIIVNYNGIEIDTLLQNQVSINRAAKEIKEKENVENNKVFLYVGGLASDKRVDLLLKTFSEFSKKYPKTYLWIIGDGPESENLKNLAKELKLLHVKFWGRVLEDSDKYFIASDYVILPGIGGLAIAQAMFWGKACIVSEADGTEEDLVEDNITGFRFAKGEIKSLSEAMERAITLDETALSEMSKKCKKIISERQNVSNMVEIFLQTISSQIGNIN